MEQSDPRRRLSKNSRNSHNKKWPLLVRSLSDSAKYRSRVAPSGIGIPNQHAKTETKALTLSLSDSRLFTHKKSPSLLDLQDVALQTLNLNKNAGDPVETCISTCSCGCDNNQEDDPDLVEFGEDEDVYSEDEGCFVITSVPQSNEETEPEEEEEEEEQEVTNKVSMHIKVHFMI